MLTAMPFFVAFVVSMIFAPGVISALRRRKVGQTISEDGPSSHLSKAGTPTMGGLIIVAGMLGGILATAWMLKSPKFALSSGSIVYYDLMAVLLLVIGYSIIGMVDDYLTIHPIRGVRGIASKPKAAAQMLLAVAFVCWLGTHRPEPFVNTLFIGGVPVLSGWLYWIFAVLFISGMANFVNITDGLDGLVSGLTCICIIAIVLGTMLVSGREGVETYPTLYALLSAIAGACLAFLWYNTNPAKVFMGDTGSLAIGVALPAIAVVTHHELLVIIAGLVFILDGLSTAVQWAVFKYTRITTGTGRRVFKKSPIHHHFELSGWPEQAVVIRFWIVGGIAALVAIIGASIGLW